MSYFSHRCKYVSADAFDRAGSQHRLTHCPTRLMTSTASPSGHTSARSSAVNTVSTATPAARARASSFVPSITNRCSRSRSRRLARARAAFTAAGGWDESLYAGEEIALAKAIKHTGRFVIVPHHVITSGRKLRTHSAREVFSVLAKACIQGRGFVKDRSSLGIWYAPRRQDPAEPGAS